MSKELTEKWKNGELFGFHYVKVPKEKPEIHNVSCMDYLLDEYGVEVIEPVPSYDMWTKHRKVLTKVQIENCDLKIMNEKLQEQLDIAVRALKEYANCKPTEWMSCVIADKALKEMEGVK